VVRAVFLGAAQSARRGGALAPGDAAGRGRGTLGQRPCAPVVTGPPRLRRCRQLRTAAARPERSGVMPSTRPLVHRIPDRLDAYALRGLMGPLLVALGVVLIAQILERLLRLFELAAATGASPLLVLKMIGSLVPHYLGIALPAAFFAAIFMATARTGDDNELDAMLATGRSITRMAVPHMLVALALVGFNLYLFGFLQPVTRYGYNLTAHEARNTGWNARLE